MRTVFYFLLYLILGPLLGIGVLTAWLSLISTENFWALLPEDYTSLVIVFGYLLGIFSASIVGLVAAFQLSRFGKSYLIITLPVAAIASAISGIYLTKNAQIGFLVMIMGTGIVSTLILRILEPLFRKRPTEADAE